MQEKKEANVYFSDHHCKFGLAGKSYIWTSSVCFLFLFWPCSLACGILVP